MNTARYGETITSSSQDCSNVPRSVESVRGGVVYFAVGRLTADRHG